MHITRFGSSLRLFHFIHVPANSIPESHFMFQWMFHHFFRLLLFFSSLSLCTFACLSPYARAIGIDTTQPNRLLLLLYCVRICVECAIHWIELNWIRDSVAGLQCTSIRMCVRCSFANANHNNNVLKTYRSLWLAHSAHYTRSISISIYLTGPCALSHSRIYE